MTSAAAVLVCAIGLLNRSPASLPPIQVVDTPPPGVSDNADAFVRRGEATIFVIRSSAAFRNARCGNHRSLRKLASILVHEEWHVRHGSDERRAYDAQLLALLRLGETHASPLYRSVYRAMQVALEAPKAAARLARSGRSGFAEGPEPVPR